MNPFKLFSPSYLFDPTPGFSFAYFWPSTIFFVLIFALSWHAASLVQKHRHQKLAKEFLGGIPARMREIALAGLTLTFFREEGIPWLGMRFWIILLVLLGVAYGVWVWRRYQKGFLERLGKQKKWEAEDLYLPRPKHKKKRKR